MFFNKFSRYSRNFAPSAFLYLFGVGALYFAEVWIARYADIETIAYWAALKSYTMIGGTFALLGLGGLMFREPNAIKFLLKIGIVQVLVISIFAGLLASKFGWAASTLIGVFSVAGFAYTNLAFQWLRSQLRLTESYIINGAWRVSFMIGVLIFLPMQFDLGFVLIYSFAIGAIFAVIILARNVKSARLTSHHKEIQGFRDIYSVGGMLFLSQISLSVSTYGEYLLANYLGDSNDVAIYFRGLVVYLYPSIMFNQYLVAAVSQIVREDDSRLLQIIKSRAWVAAVGLLVLVWPCIYLFGYFMELFFYKENSTPFVMAALLSLTGCVRCYYILPSTYVGVLAGRKILLTTSIVYFTSSLLFPLLSFGFLFLGLSVTVSIALASLVNWIVRSAVGTKFIIQRIKTI